MKKSIQNYLHIASRVEPLTTLKRTGKHSHIAGTAIILAAVLAGALVLTGCPNDTSDSSDNYATGGNIVSTADDLISALADPKNGDTVYFIGGNIDKPVSVPTNKKVIITNIDSLPNAGATSAVVSSGDGATSLTSNMVVVGSLTVQAGSLTVSKADDEHIGSLDVAGAFVAKEGTSVEFGEETRFYVYGTANFEGENQLTLNTGDVFAVPGGTTNSDLLAKSAENTTVVSVTSSAAVPAAFSEGVKIVVLTGGNYGTTAINGLTGDKTLYVAGDSMDTISSINIPALKVLNSLNAGTITVSGMLTNNGDLFAGTLAFGDTGKLDNTSSISDLASITAGASNEVVNAGLITTSSSSFSSASAALFKNDGVIVSQITTDQAALIKLASPAGTGIVKLTGDTSTADGAAIVMGQNVEIGSGKTFKVPTDATPFSGDKTITLNDGSTLEFGATVTSLGATIKNQSSASNPAVAKTTATTAAAVNGFLGLDLGINTMEASGALAGTDPISITVPAGKTLKVTGTWTNTGTVTLAGNVVVDGAIKASSSTIGLTVASGTLTLKTNHSSAITGGVAANGNINITGTNAQLKIGSGSSLTGTGTITVTNDSDTASLVAGGTGLTASSSGITFNVGASSSTDLGWLPLIDLDAATGDLTSVATTGNGAVSASQAATDAIATKLLAAANTSARNVLLKSFTAISGSNTALTVPAGVRLALDSGSTLANATSLTMSGGKLTIIASVVTAGKVISASTTEPVKLLGSGVTASNINALLISSNVKYVSVGSALNDGGKIAIQSSTKLELCENYTGSSSSSGFLLGSSASLVIKSGKELTFTSSGSTAGIFASADGSTLGYGIKVDTDGAKISHVSSSTLDAVISGKPNGTELSVSGAALKVDSSSYMTVNSSGLTINTSSGIIGNL